MSFYFIYCVCIKGSKKFFFFLYCHSRESGNPVFLMPSGLPLSRERQCIGIFPCFVNLTQGGREFNQGKKEFGVGSSELGVKKIGMTLVKGASEGVVRQPLLII
jgi:hypothetical protein